MLNVVMLSVTYAVVLLVVIYFNCSIILNVVMLNVIMLNVIMMNVVILSVVRSLGKSSNPANSTVDNLKAVRTKYSTLAWPVLIIRNEVHCKAERAFLALKRVWLRFCPVRSSLFMV
jgi:hypothetical protein